MATLQNPVIPRVKLEAVSDGNVKQELVDEDMASPYMDIDDEGLEDGGDLDFSSAQHELWLTQIPRPLWDAWSTMGLDDEIEIGTVRLEGPDLKNPQRVREPFTPASSYY